jgi:hypothetical protein
MRFAEDKDFRLLASRYNGAQPLGLTYVYRLLTASWPSFVLIILAEGN